MDRIGGIAVNRLLTLVLAILLIGAGCRREEDRTRVGFISSSFNDTLQYSIMEAARTFFDDKPEYELVFQDAQEDVMRQQDLAFNFISHKVKALIVVPVNTGAMLPITNAAAAAGIPLIYVNRNPFEKGYLPPNVYYVGPQDLVGGQTQMETMGRLLNGKGNVAILEGKLDSDGAILRTLGNEGIVRQKFPDIKILAKESGNWQRDQGMSITARWLSVYGYNLNGIVGNNDEMALGAVEALRAAGRSDVFVIGLDAIDDAKAAIANGSMAATLLQDETRQGSGAAELAYQALRGELMRTTAVWVPFILITKDNLDQY
jgi:inositol transport system substrate-binding protein